MGHKTYIHAARRETKCRCCNGPIEAGRIHFYFGYWMAPGRRSSEYADYAWGKS